MDFKLLKVSEIVQLWLCYVKKCETLKSHLMVVAECGFCLILWYE